MEAWVRTVLVFVLLDLSAAWTHGLSRKQAFNRAETYSFPWAPARRSAYLPCAYTGQRCLTTSQCCNEHDVCVTGLKYNAVSGDKGRVSTCKDVRKDRKYSEHATQLKSSGQICADSSECRDLCCREIRGHRAMYHVCGSPEDDFMAYTCVQATRTGNDVLDDLL